MPGIEASESRVSPGLLSTANLVTPASPVVTPSAVAALSDAFRNGFITADDIASRAGELAKKRQKVELQLLNETGSDEAIRARQLALQAASARAQQQTAQSQAQTPLAQPAADLTLDQIEQQQALIKYPAAQYFQQTGMNTPLTAEGRPDYAKMAKIGSQWLSWATDKKLAQEERSNIEDARSPDGTVLFAKTKQGIPVPVSHVKELDAKIGRPFQFIEPGAFVQPAVAPAAAAAAPMTPAQVASTVTPKGATPVTLYGADAQAAADAASANAARAAGAPAATPMVTPKVAAPPVPGEKPEIAPMTQIGDQGFYLGAPSAKNLQERAPTEAQQRAQLALSRFAQSNDMLKSLQEAGYDPTSMRSWMGDFLPEVLKSGNRKAYNAAIDAWSQGLLRLESGAAIARQEKSWYERAFFPAVNDPPHVVESKAAMRRDIEHMVGEIAQAGAVVSPESADKIRRIYAQAGQNVGKSPTAPSQAGGVQTLSSGRKLQRGADGQLYEVK